MDFELTEDQRAIVDAVEALLNVLGCLRMVVSWQLSSTARAHARLVLCSRSFEMS